jgi:hypothetical protein
MAFPFIYITDKDKYVDTASGKATYFGRKQLEVKLQAHDDKYASPAACMQAIADITSAGITDEQFQSSRKSKKKGVSFAQIWEELRELVPLYKRTNNNGQSQIFFVGHNNEVSKIDYTDSDALVDAIMHRKDIYAGIRQFYNEASVCEDVRDKLSLKTFLIKMLTEFLLADERHLIDYEPLQISWDPDDYAYKKMDSSLLRSGPTPTWNEFTSRLDYPAVFMAWVWSIFEPTNNIRQVMWLKGAGNDGKSSIQKAIEGVLGRDYCYSMKYGDENQQWFQKNVFGKVLTNYADCRNVYLIDSNSIKQLTGGDTTSIEGKGENSFTGKIYSKLLVTSNYNPRINPELQAHTSRLIKLEVAPQADTRKDSGFEKRLQDEIYPFLCQCRDAFEALISKGNERLELPEELVQKMRVDCASETYLNVQDFVQAHVEFGVEQVCNPADLKKTSKEYFLLEKRLTNEQLKFHMAELEAKFYLQGCSLVRLGAEGAQTTMWRGLVLKQPDKGVQNV